MEETLDIYEFLEFSQLHISKGRFLAFLSINALNSRDPLSISPCLLIFLIFSNQFLLRCLYVDPIPDFVLFFLLCHLLSQLRNFHQVFFYQLSQLPLFQMIPPISFPSFFLGLQWTSLFEVEFILYLSSVDSLFPFFILKIFGLVMIYLINVKYKIFMH